MIFRKNSNVNRDKLTIRYAIVSPVMIVGLLFVLLSLRLVIGNVLSGNSAHTNIERGLHLLSANKETIQHVCSQQDSGTALVVQVSFEQQGCAFVTQLDNGQFTMIFGQRTFGPYIAIDLDHIWVKPDGSTITFITQVKGGFAVVTNAIITQSVATKELAISETKKLGNPSSYYRSTSYDPTDFTTGNFQVIDLSDASVTSTVNSAADVTSPDGNHTAHISNGGVNGAISFKDELYIDNHSIDSQHGFLWVAFDPSNKHVVYISGANASLSEYIVGIDGDLGSGTAYGYISHRKISATSVNYNGINLPSEGLERFKKFQVDWVTRNFE